MRAIIGVGIFSLVLWFLLYFFVFSLISEGCDSLEKSGNGSIMNGLGKEIKEINDNFNKGYKKK